MLTDAWRGRPRLLGVPDAKDPRERKGLVERIHEMAVRRRVDTVLIEKETRGTDLYMELERIMSEWPYRLQYFDPRGRGDKAMRLEACVPLFTQELVWAPNKSWSETVIDEVSTAPRGQFNDLADCVSMGLLHYRNSGMLSTKVEHRREYHRARVFKGRGFSAAELIEGR
jgi:phage terminase large subunit-like protein